jgi:putative spermidine/putrescine transport system permease protein
VSGPSIGGTCRAVTSPPDTVEERPRAGPSRRLATYFYRHPRARLGSLLVLPIGWLVVGYIGSLAVMLVSAFWYLDPFTAQVVHEPTLKNFDTLLSEPVYRTITLRTVTMAAAVTVACAVLAFPIAYYMARIASKQTRRIMVVAVLVPLWASYLVKVYAWRTILAENGVLNWLLAPFGLEGPGYSLTGTWLVFTYLWLPYMILPIYAGLERIPPSLLEASADLGARSGRTFLRVVLPLAFPAIIAGSIFTFALTLGDYITPEVVSSKQFIGNVIYDNIGVANNLPFAAAYATVPILIMVLYLYIAKRLGAFENL